jgi:hypothetical protein
MVICMSSFPVFTQSTIDNTSNEIRMNETKSQQWILGMLIGSAPFLFIIFCWIFVSLCIKNLITFYQYNKKRQQHVRRKTNTESTV